MRIKEWLKYARGGIFKAVCAWRNLNSMRNILGVWRDFYSNSSCTKGVCHVHTYIYILTNIARQKRIIQQAIISFSDFEILVMYICMDMLDFYNSGRKHQFFGLWRNLK